MIYNAHNDYVDPEGRGFEAAYSSLRDLDLTVEQCFRDLKPRWDAGVFTSLVAMGNSSLVVAAPLALRLRCPLVIVRKRSQDNAGGAGLVVGRTDCGERPLFIDDFISEGKTMARASARIEMPLKGGAYLYNRGGTYQHYDEARCIMNGRQESGEPIE